MNTNGTGFTALQISERHWHSRTREQGATGPYAEIGTLRLFCALLVTQFVENKNQQIHLVEVPAGSRSPAKLNGARVCRCHTPAVPC